MLLEVEGTRLLTDPVLRERVMHLRRRVPPPAAEAIERIDAVLISHLHHDHLDIPSLRQVGTGVPMLVPRGAGAFMRHKGFTEVEELSAGESAQVGPLGVAAVPAEHRAKRWPIVGPAAPPIGFDVQASTRVLFVGDTGLHSGMGELSGAIDVALLPVWGWGPHLGSGHLDPRRAALAARLIRPRLAIPVHWGTLFRMGPMRRHGHLLREPPLKFAARVSELAPDVEVRVLEPGESLALSR